MQRSLKSLLTQRFKDLNVTVWKTELIPKPVQFNFQVQKFFVKCLCPLHCLGHYNDFFFPLKTQYPVCAQSHRPYGQGWRKYNNKVFSVPKSCHFGSGNLFFISCFVVDICLIQKNSIKFKIIHVGLFAVFFFFFFWFWGVFWIIVFF